jgi:hypothetical protein
MKKDKKKGEWSSSGAKFWEDKIPTMHLNL